MRLCVRRLPVLDCPGDNDPCTSGAGADCRKANVFSGSDQERGGNMNRRSENKLDKGDRRDGENVEVRPVSKVGVVRPGRRWIVLGGW